jgi:hypothetical protein
MWSATARLLAACCCLCLPVAVAVAAPTTSVPVDESSRAAAREIGYAGVDAYRAGDYVTASERLDKAFAILRAPSLGLWSARALVKLGKLIEAQERYLEVGRLPTAVGDQVIQRQARDDAQREAAELAPRIPKLIVRVEGAPAGEVTVTIDEVPVLPALLGESRPINPGRHVIVAASGGERTALELTLKEAARETAVLRIPGRVGAAAPVPAAPPPSPAPVGDLARAPDRPADGGAGQGSGGATPRRLLGTVVTTAGGVALLGGALAGVLALARRDDLSSSGECAGQVCALSQSGAVDSYNSLRVWSSVGLLAGAALATAGIVILATSPPRPEAAGSTVTLGVGVFPGVAVVRGNF